MYFQAQSLSLSEALNRIRSGKCLDGCEIPIRQILAVLAGDSQPDTVWTIERAVVTSFELRADFNARGLCFRDCEIHGSVSFRAVTGLSSISFIDCSFDQNLCIEDCVGLQSHSPDLDFRSREGIDIRLVNVRVAGQVLIRGNAFRRLMRLKQCHFEAELLIESNGAKSAELKNDIAEPSSVYFMLNDCQFEGRMRYEETFEEGLLSFPFPAFKVVGIAFQNCRFSAGSFTELRIATAANHGRVELQQCSVEGRVIVNPPSWESYQATEGIPFDIDLSSSLVRGEVDLSSLLIGTLELFETRIDGGRVIVSCQQLENDIIGRLPWRWNPADRISRLRVEKLFWSQLAMVGTVYAGYSLSELARDVSIQFDELCNGWVRTSVGDPDGDFYYYKARDYDRRRSTLILFPDLRAVVRNVTAWWVSLFFLWAVLPGTIIELLWFLLFWIVGVVFYLRRRTLVAVSLLWDWIVLKWFLGYGVYASRVVATGIILILLYPVVYWSFIAFGHGTLLTDCNVSVLEVRIDNGISCDEMTIQRRTRIDAFLQLVYFSGVTFTTLGYGDYRPGGWLRLVAVSEALLGAATIALLTVIFARKFLRR